MQNKSILVFSIFLLSFGFSVTGQKLINSPYARFNIGTLEPVGSFRSQGMGGVGIGIRDNSSIYYLNPASYSAIDTNSFIFDFGLDYGLNVLSDGDTKFQSDDFNFDHLLIGFPIAKGFGFATGIMPISNGYYKLAESIKEGDPGYDPVTGAYASIHYGDGSLSTFFLGSGINITKNLSAGVNMTVLFGQLRRVNQFAFEEFLNSFHNSLIEKLQLGGINFDYGLQYTANLKNNRFITAGISVTSGKYYKSKIEQVASTYSGYGSIDTIAYVFDDSKRAYIPGTLRFGISYSEKNKLTLGLDFISTKWSNAKIPGSGWSAADTKTVIAGFEYIPDRFSNYSFMKRMEYRAGVHYGDNYLIMNGEQIKEYGASIGIGMLLRRTYSKANFFIDFTRKTGSFENGLHNENFLNAGISLNFFDFWFIKRKYD